MCIIRSMIDGHFISAASAVQLLLRKVGGVATLGRAFIIKFSAAKLQDKCHRHGMQFQVNISLSCATIQPPAERPYLAISIGKYGV